MGDINFYNSEKMKIMQWHNFLLENSEKRDALTFDVKIQTSIFTVSAKYKTYLKDLLALKNNVNLLYQQRLNKVAYYSFDEKFSVELEWERLGHIKQTFVVIEEQTNSRLEVGCLFDQTFLPELETDIEDTLIEINNLEKCYE